MAESQESKKSDGSRQNAYLSKARKARKLKEKKILVNKALERVGVSMETLGVGFFGDDPPHLF